MPRKQPTSKPKYTKPNYGKWRPILLVAIYRMLRLGISDAEIARQLKVHVDTLYEWRRDKPELAETYAIAQKEIDETSTFSKWVYQRLSSKLREIWDRLEEHNDARTGHEMIELILQDHGKSTRQELFLYALCMNDFSYSKAMQKVNISKAVLDSWVQDDPDFSQLVDEILWHKKNFYDDLLVSLAKEGNPTAIIFANKTLNRDRGYGPHHTLDVNHSGQVLHGVMDLSEIMEFLSDTSRAEIMEALRQKEEKSQRLLRGDNTPEVIDIIAREV